jgi:2-oxoglutarate dehydrogenase E2 component (dihydrolipoamide succinyltransferase)
MRVDIKVPSVGESITEVEIGEWLKHAGDLVSKNENLLLLETDKATVEIHAPESGKLTEILKKAGDGAAIGEVIGRIETNGGGVAARNAPHSDGAESGAKAPQPAKVSKPPDTPATEHVSPRPSDTTAPEERLPPEPEPSEREMEIVGAKERAAQLTQDAEPPDVSSAETASDTRTEPVAAPSLAAERRDEAVPMSALRRRIAERLVAAQQQAALLTTFNEIDMAEIVALRRSQGEAFQAKHNVKLGFMSFFIKSAVTALRSIREINAEIRGDKIVYHNYYDIGVAVGGGKGLVVPVLRDAERLSFAEIERTIADFAHRARENLLRPDELRGGTFTITNGGVYGSLFSTPIINPPQSAILGLHAVQDRPMARNGQVVVRPMMYAALTYDHRIVDGREAVLFLKQIKTLIEEPVRLLLES